VDKRFLLFLALSFVVLMINGWVMRQLAPPPPVGPQIAQPAGDHAAGEGGDQLGLAADAPGAPPTPPPLNTADVPAPDETQPAPEQPGPEQPAPAVNPPEAVAAAQQPNRFLTLGSLDPDSPFRLLATFTSHGAAVRRLELSSEHFRDLHDRSGYLGHFEAIKAPGGGALLRVVGAGTPAAEAGLLAEDVVTAINDLPVANAAQLLDRLAETSPGDQIRIAATRDGAAVPEMTATLTRRPLEVMRPEQENVLLYRAALPADFQDPPSFRLTLSQLDDKTLSDKAPELPGVGMLDANWEVVDAQTDAKRVTFRYELPAQGVVIEKVFRVAKVPDEELANELYPAYHLELEIRIQNESSQKRSVGYQLDGPTGLPIEGWWYANKIGRKWFSAAGLRDVAVQFRGGDAELISASSIAKDDTEALGQNQSLMYMGVDAQYFACMLIPKKAVQSDVWLTESRAMRIGPKPEKGDRVSVTSVTTRMTSQPLELAPDESTSYTYTVFAGPKKPALLAEYKQPGDKVTYTLDPLVYYGMFTPVAKVMLGLLHVFERVVGNYGIAIILLTVLVRSCLFPISRKQALNMQKMQELQPEIKKLTEKYKTDLEKRTRAQQELFRKHNYHPLAGCLPALLQFPIFIGLYRSLMVDVELRQAPLFSSAIHWCSNLAAPDMLWNWSSLMPDVITKGSGIFGLGPYLNLLPIVTIGLFVLQSTMFMPPPADDNAAMQQKIMKFMFIFMGFLFYRVASGLCLYFVASTLWGITERKLIPKTMAAKKTPETTPEGKKRIEPPPPPGPNGSGGKQSKAKKKKQK